jgi:hypothetical protein
MSKFRVVEFRFSGKTAPRHVTPKTVKGNLSESQAKTLCDRLNEKTINVVPKGETSENEVIVSYVVRRENSKHQESRAA